MRILVFSDIHANLSALESVLKAAGNVDAAWCLGDVVGYGPDPNECVAIIQELPNLVCLQGNHDAAVIGDLTLDGFNVEARTSVEWQIETVDTASREFLQSLRSRTEAQGVTLAHASPRQPVLEYLLDIYSASENFEFFATPFCFVGHTHIPVIFTHEKDGVKLNLPEANSTLNLQERCIANPGSVGQPRDRDPRASFVIFDDRENTWEQRRVEYDITAVQDRMQSAGLPERHIERLATGW